jgi:endoglucanase
MKADNQLDPAWLKTLDWVVASARTNNLTVILDEHDFNAMGKDPDAGRPRLLAFWSQIAERYKDAPDSVLFEILNEPNGKMNDASWNALLKEALAIIRKTNPTRNVVIGPASWNSIHNLSML